MTVWLNEKEPCWVVHKVTSLAIAAVSLGPTTHLMIQWFHYSMWLSATGVIPIRPFTIAINISRAMRRLTGGQTRWEVQHYGWRCDDPREMEHVLMFYMTSSAWRALARILRWLNTTGKADINKETHQESFYTVLTAYANTHTHMHTYSPLHYMSQRFSSHLQQTMWQNSNKSFPLVMFRYSPSVFFLIQIL